VPLSQPPRNGSTVTPHDHVEILNGDDLIRRISEEQVVTVGGVRRISSIAFQPSGGANGGMSIDIKKSIEEAQLIATDFVTTPKWIGSVIFKAEAPRSLELQVGYDPQPDNIHHGEIWGAFSKAKSKSIQRASAWFVPIPEVAVA
jgi:hypothetical protein